MEENKDEGMVIAESNEKIDHLAPIKEMAKATGMEMPDLVATGDLTVEVSKEKLQVVDDKPEDKPFNKKDIPLPELGTKFMVLGHEYKIVYINDGKHRFSCEPCKGIY